MDRVQITKPATSTRSCQRCTHFRPSVKEQPGMGLCAFYNLITSRQSSCTHGFQPIAQARPLATR